MNNKGHTSESFRQNAGRRTKTIQMPPEVYEEYEQALRFTREKQYNSSIAIINDLLSRGYKGARIYTAGAAACTLSGQYDKALEYWEQAIENDRADATMATAILRFIQNQGPQTSPDYTNRAEALIHKMIFEKKIIDKVLASQYAGYLRDENRPDDELKILKQAIELEKADIRIYWRASTILRVNNPYDAINVLKKAVKADQADTRLYTRLANLYEKSCNDVPSAIRVLRTCHERGKGDDITRSRLAELETSLPSPSEGAP